MHKQKRFTDEKTHTATRPYKFIPLQPDKTFSYTASDISRLVCQSAAKKHPDMVAKNIVQVTVYEDMKKLDVLLQHDISGIISDLTDMVCEAVKHQKPMYSTDSPLRIKVVIGQVPDWETKEHKRIVEHFEVSFELSNARGAHSFDYDRVRQQFEALEQKVAMIGGGRIVPTVLPRNSDTP